LIQHLQVIGLLLLYLKEGGNATFVRVLVHRSPIKCSVQYNVPVSTKAKPRNDFGVCHIIKTKSLAYRHHWSGRGM